MDIQFPLAAFVYAESQFLGDFGEFVMALCSDIPLMSEGDDVIKAWVDDNRDEIRALVDQVTIKLTALNLKGEGEGGSTPEVMVRIGLAAACETFKYRTLSFVLNGELELTEHHWFEALTELKAVDTRQNLAACRNAIDDWLQKLEHDLKVAKM